MICFCFDFLLFWVDLKRMVFFTFYLFFILLDYILLLQICDQLNYLMIQFLVNLLFLDLIIVKSEQRHNNIREKVMKLGYVVHQLT